MSLAETSPKDGAAIPLSLTIVDTDGVPVDLSTASQKDFVICDENGEKVRETSPTISGANNNIMTYVTVKDTDLTPPGTYHFYGDITDSAGRYFPTNSIRLIVKSKCAE